MDKEQEGRPSRKSFSRREFLTNGAKLGGLLALPLLSFTQSSSGQAAGKATSMAGAREARRVGVLLPRSAIYPGLGASFMAGMDLYFSQAGRRDITVVSDSIGSGAGSVQQKAETLVLAEKAELLVGIVNPGVASALHYALESLQATFIASSLGENMPRGDEHSPYVFHHTLGMWQANWALGQWAAKNLGRKGLLAASFYDSGFDALYAFRMGFESAGGKVLSSEVSHHPSAQADLRPLIAGIKAARPDVVFASYCGQPAADFLAAYSRAGLFGSVPLVGTAFLGDQQLLAKASSPADLRTALSWSAALDTAENRSFVAAYSAKTGKAPDAFALLGFEAAHLAAAAFDRVSGGAASLIDALATASFAGPRGEVAMDSRTHSTAARLYLQHVTGHGSAVRTSVLGELNAVAEQDRQVAALRQSVKTGWLNSYLCG